MKKKFMIVGGGGRESAFAANLAADSILYAVISHENPTIMRCVSASGGESMIGNVNDGAAIAEFARQHQVEYVFVSADEPLACGVTDILRQHNIKTIGASQAAARIEWDKIYSIDLMQQVCPQLTPFYQVVTNTDELDNAIAQFRAENKEIVVKPQGLTGGKGVKVMPNHLPTYAAAADYAAELLTDNKPVLLVEKLHGLEFTVMGITDGEHLVIAPATYDYPYRLAQDQGPGTGGMGCFTAAGEKTLPFMQPQHLEDCRDCMQKIIDKMRRDGTPFNGVLNGGFFLTKDGIRFMEFNSRFGDPEALNIIALLQTPLSAVLEDIWRNTLAEEQVCFSPQASVVKYLVAKEYPQASPQALPFTVNETAINAMDVAVHYASCIQTADGNYQTLKKSRVVALTALAPSIAQASEMVNRAIQQHITGALDYRSDIGSIEEIDRLSRFFNPAA